MLTFYYSSGSSAVAAHILLEEIGTPYTAVDVPISKGAHRNPGFLQLNPKGRIPVLETPNGVITENPAILEYVAATNPSAGFLPEGAFAQAQARSLCAYLCATAHVAFAHSHRGLRWAKNDASIREMQSQVPDNLRACADFLESDLELSPWTLGPSYSFCDPYLYQFTRWLSASGVPIDAYPKLAAHRSAIRARPATQRVLEQHGLS